MTRPFNDMSRSPFQLVASVATEVSRHGNEYRFTPPRHKTRTAGFRQKPIPSRFDRGNVLGLAHRLASKVRPDHDLEGARTINQRILSRTVFAGAVLGLLAASQVLAQTAPPVRVRGTVEMLHGEELMVKSRDGKDVTIKLAPNYSVTEVIKASLSDITVGKFVGIAAMPNGNGPLKASEVVVFPEAARGSGEGHYAWDLAPGSTMTNATVASEVANVNGPTLTLKHKDGQNDITVPKDVPIVTFGPADKELLVPGAHVFVPAMKQADGSLIATRILVGKDGVTPPM